MPISWSDEALSDLQLIFDQLAVRSPHFAGRFVQRVTESLERVAGYPMLGRMIPEFGVPQLREVLQPPYRVMYRVKPNEIEVIAVAHSSIEFERL